MGKIFTCSLESFLSENSYSIKENIETEKKNVLSGTSAYSGKARGIVKKIFTKHDFSKFNKDDILVSPMTIPDFVPAMKKAAAIVTDEGGITCHAAIIARELKKPCVIGTKIATQVLKDGDLVEVDADRGVVTILQSANKKTASGR